MEFAKNETTELEKTVAAAEGAQVSELDELQLAFVGGGSVTVIFG
jgi:hypothetical protein